ncbi:unnamed protein product [Chrysoparadoxa australica]
MTQRSKRQLTRRADRYDGEVIWAAGEAAYELGHFLGGGAAGVVYEATDLLADPAERNVAVKVLNPVGFKLMQAATLQRCVVLHKGQPLGRETKSSAPASPSGEKDRQKLGQENVWWLVHPNSKQVIAAYVEPKFGSLTEIPLPKCIEIWGLRPWEELRQDEGLVSGQPSPRSRASLYRKGEEALDRLLRDGTPVVIDGLSAKIPKVPPKYIKWVKHRRAVFREIYHMAHLGGHPNVVNLSEVLELVQDSKSCLFVVMELATGGELFDRLKMGYGTNEKVTKKYMRQMLSGVQYCHSRGVCHRDLKPENLLLSSSDEEAQLKIADFGLSAAFALAAERDRGQASDTEEEKCTGNGYRSQVGGQGHRIRHDDQLRLQRLKSVVGSPHYVAPEVSQANPQGYDGAAADVWSMGVILYVMLVGHLPFGKDLSQCQRYQRFKIWRMEAGEQCKGIQVGASLDWFFPSHVSLLARHMLVSMLHPDQSRRMSVDAASRHVWLAENEEAASTGLAQALSQLEM